MLHSMNWLTKGKSFPPLGEKNRIERYKQNALLFDGEHFADSDVTNATSGMLNLRESAIPDLYRDCARRISRVVGNFESVISFPVLINYQRLMTLKMADLVCGEYPQISGKDAFENEAIKETREYTDFDAKLYEAVIDISRYGESIQRIYKDAFGRLTFTNWTPMEWYPVVSQDGTNTILKQCLCWRENLSTDAQVPDWRLHVQIHGTQPEDIGYYEYRVFKLDSLGGTIGQQVSSSKIPTGLKVCAVSQLKAFSTTSTVYGYDDYVQIDSVLAEIMVRVGQISVILDKHADPSMTGPVTMLEVDPITGTYRLKSGKFFAVSPGEEQPKYMTWDGQLNAAFQQLELLINQLYILSEMGAALLGSTDGSSGAISGTAMRFKMVNPLAKARRVSNSLTKPIKRLFAALSEDAEVPDDFKEKLKDEDIKMTLPIEQRNISVFWYDGLPDDPRENIENAKLATGATKLMPLENALREFFGRSEEEALTWIDQIKAETAEEQAAALPDPNHGGPQDGTGVNPNKKGSDTGLTAFHSPTNQPNAQ